jgi:hypothetical protein
VLLMTQTWQGLRRSSKRLLAPMLTLAIRMSETFATH